MTATAYPHPAALPVDQLLLGCDIQFGRTSGPGGQHRNKVETACRIVHRETGLLGQADERRQREQNRRQAIFRLRVNLAIDLRLPPPTEPSRLWMDRNHGGRIAVNPEHEDFPALLAEALDQCCEHRYDLPTTAKILAVTGSQLLKFIAKAPKALAKVNGKRKQLGKPTFKL